MHQRRHLYTDPRQFHLKWIVNIFSVVICAESFIDIDDVLWDITEVRGVFFLPF